MKNDSIFIDSNSIFYSNNIYENYLHIDKNAKNKKEFNKILDITEFPRDKFDNNAKFKNLSIVENQRYSINIFISVLVFIFR